MDVAGVSVRIDPPLHDLLLADVLEAIVKTADHPIQYSIEDYAVVFSPKRRETTPLYFRTIKLDPANFEEVVRKALGAPGDTNGGAATQTALRRFFESSGMDFLPRRHFSYSTVKEP